jgi:hypothetical protein
MLDYGIFYEFIPMDTFGTLDKSYSISLWNCLPIMLWVQLILVCGAIWLVIPSFHVIKPYRIGNGKNQTSHQCFGEELMVENTDQAIAKACKPTQMEVSITPWLRIYGRQRKRCPWMDDWIKNPPADVSQFQKALDESIQSLNSDYEAKRYNNMTLNPTNN